MEAKAKVRVLLVDDEANLRLYFKTLINSIGGEVVGEAANGREAIEMFEKLKPDFIFLDINMPVMGGVTALKAIRALSNQVGISMLSSLGSADVESHCLEMGANYHLRKDLPLEQMRAQITNAWKWLDEVKARGGSL